VSITFEYSFNAPLELPELVAAVNRALGSSFVKAEESETVYSCDFLGMPTLLERHDYQDDRALNFTDYRYQLSNKTWADSALRRIQLETLVLIAFVLHETLGISNAMLSYEMQRVLARYGVAGEEWCDMTTGKAVESAEHIVDLLQRLDALV
jgi:hypothetical protein